MTVPAGVFRLNVNIRVLFVDLFQSLQCDLVTAIAGLVMSQLLTLYTTPVVYLFFDRLRVRFSRKQKETVTG